MSVAERVFSRLNAHDPLPTLEIDSTDRNAQILSRLEDGATYRTVAADFGISAGRIAQIVRAENAKIAASDCEDLDSAALRLRHRRALELVAHASEEERFELLVFVVAPSKAVADASRAAVLAQATAPVRSRRRREGVCVGCGVDTTTDAATVGCNNCSERLRSRRRRARVAA